MKLTAAVCLALLVAAALSYSAAAKPSTLHRPTGVKLTIRETTTEPRRNEPRVVAQARYIRSDRYRYDYSDNISGGAAPRLRWVSIARCDLHQSFFLDFEKRQYDWMPIRPTPSRAHMTAFAAWWGIHPQPLRGQPTFVIEITTQDTGERQTMFGREARHVITTRRQSPLAPPSHDTNEAVTDGWYTDLDMGVSCERASGYALATLTTVGEVPSFKYNGRPETGFLLAGRTTSRSSDVLPDGTTTDYESTSETSVTELTEAPLPDSLFEIPRGFHERPISLAERWNRYVDAFKGTLWRWFY